MCGLKYQLTFYWFSENLVTPHVGVWIEIFMQIHMIKMIYVTPHVGVWIEITSGTGGTSGGYKSHLT